MKSESISSKKPITPMMPVNGPTKDQILQQTQDIDARLLAIVTKFPNKWRTDNKPAARPILNLLGVVIEKLHALPKQPQPIPLPQNPNPTSLPSEVWEQKQQYYFSVSPDTKDQVNKLMIVLNNLQPLDSRADAIFCSLEQEITSAYNDYRQQEASCDYKAPLAIILLLLVGVLLTLAPICAHATWLSAAAAVAVLIGGGIVTAAAGFVGTRYFYHTKSQHAVDAIMKSTRELKAAIAGAQFDKDLQDRFLAILDNILTQEPPQATSFWDSLFSTQEIHQLMQAHHRAVSLQKAAIGCLFTNLQGPDALEEHTAVAR